MKVIPCLLLCAVFASGCGKGSSLSEISEESVAIIKEGRIRPPAVAGSFYAGDAGELDKQIEKSLTGAKKVKIDGQLVAAVVPHAGYYFSGRCAASLYSRLNKGVYKRVIILGPSHYVRFRGVVVPDSDITGHQTPMGVVAVDMKVCGELAGKEGFLRLPGADSREHSIEVQLPFLQKKLIEFKCVPLLCGAMSDADVEKYAEAIVPYMDEETLLLASSDFTHYGDRFGYMPFRKDRRKGLYNLLNRATGLISSLDLDGFNAHLKETGDTVCGQVPVKILMAAVKRKHGRAKGALLDAYTSGDVVGDFGSSVSYGAVGFFVAEGKGAKK